MGLDMHLTGKKFHFSNFDHPEKEPMEYGFKVSSISVELGYWRKHPNLHGYIVHEFGDDVDECQEIPLSKEDIQQIISAVEEDNFETIEGFFFGTSEGADYQNTTEQFKKALKWLTVKEENAAKYITYRASW